MTAPATNGSPVPAPGPTAGLDPNRARRSELGRPGNLQVLYSTRGEKQYAPKYSDPNPALRFPLSVKVYDVMTRTDDQVDAVMRAVSLPILDAPWDLNDKGVSAEVVQFVRDEIGLPEPGEAMQNRRRGQAGIVFLDHLREALDALAYGFAPFEQSYSTTLPGEAGHPKGPRWASQPAVHLWKLAARSPATIRRIRLAADGGLVSIIQEPPEGEPDWFNRPDGEPGIEIPVDRLVMYVTDRKGADWTGVSILRTAYAPWKAKEQFRRLDVQAAERNSMGLPVIHYDPAVMTEDEALEIAVRARAGAEAGIAVPLGMSFELVGVSGSVPDLTPKIEAYNQAIGRASLAMFLNLGHDNGARALGDTFLAFFTRAVKGIADQYARTFTEHVIRDLVEWNFGPDEPYPRLVPGEITAEMALAPDGLGQLITAGVIVPDDVLEEHMRKRYRLPAADTATSRGQTEPEPEPDPATPTDADGNPLVPVDPEGNPFKPSDSDGEPPAGETPAGDDDEPAAAKPKGKDRNLGDEVPAGMVRVAPHVRRLPAGKASLAGYAAYLAAQVTDE